MAGRSVGITSTNAVGKKKAYEAEFQKRVTANPAWNEKYGIITHSTWGAATINTCLMVKEGIILMK